jgi:hypothetical protein
MDRLDRAAIKENVLKDDTGAKRKQPIRFLLMLRFVTRAHEIDFQAAGLRPS